MADLEVVGFDTVHVVSGLLFDDAVGALLYSVVVLGALHGVVTVIVTGVIATVTVEWRHELKGAHNVGVGEKEFVEVER